MSAKSKSHEAAQRKVWKAELKAIDANRRKVLRDFDSARRPLAKAARDAASKLAAFDKRASRQKPRVLTNIERRRGILVGKLGL